jgi:hypothetical protein
MLHGVFFVREYAHKMFKRILQHRSFIKLKIIVYKIYLVCKCKLKFSSYKNLKMLPSIFQLCDCISIHHIEIGCYEALNNCYMYTYICEYVYVNINVTIQVAGSLLTS